jgi:predicted permease
MPDDAKKRIRYNLSDFHWISFCIGFVACLIAVLCFYRITITRFKTTKEICLHSSRSKNIIVIPAGVELIQTNQIDDYLLNDDTYYLSINLYHDDVTQIYKPGFKEIWLRSKNE